MRDGKAINPVWYVDETPGHDWTIKDALNGILNSAKHSQDFRLPTFACGSTVSIR